MKTASVLATLLLLSTGAGVPTARAERTPVATLWFGSADLRAHQQAVAQVEAALTASPDVAPLADGEARRVLAEGGPVTFVRERLAAGRERFAALRDLPEADALLAEAEAAALGGLPVAAACPLLVEVERLRLRFAELTSDAARAGSAALLLGACASRPTAEDAAAVARHPAPPALASPALRVESDPPGAAVYLDLLKVGVTPLDLPAQRRPRALLDVEQPGLRKVHRVLDDKGGTLALALGRDDGVGALVDKIRATEEAPEADVADLARRVGAGRLIALRLGRPGVIEARLFDVARASWTKEVVEIAAPPPPGALDSKALLAYLTVDSPPAAAPPPPVAAAAPTGKAGASPAGASQAAVAAAPTAAPVPAYKRWYTWVIGGVLVAGVVAYVVAGHIGDDQLTVHVAR